MAGGEQQTEPTRERRKPKLVEARMKKHFGAMLAVVFVISVSGSVTLGAGPIQTQMAMGGGVEVDVIKATAREGILTVVLAYRNTGKTAVAIRAQLNESYYLDSKKRKYQVLRDSKNAWIAAPTYLDLLTVDVGPGETKAAWLKFPAPSDKENVIDLIISGVLPFEELAVTQ
jgi:hypothetical protein